VKRYGFGVEQNESESRDGAERVEWGEVDLPPRAPEFALKSPKGVARFFAWVWLVLLVGGAGMMAVAGFDVANRLRSMFPLQTPEDVLLAICSAFCIGILAVMTGVIVFAAISSFYTQRTTFRIDRRHLMIIGRQGFWRWTRRISVLRIRRLVVAPAATSTTRTLALPVEQRPARVLIETNDCKRGWVSRSLPRSVARDLAREVSRQWAAVGISEAELTVIDATDPALLNGEFASLPFRTTLRIDEDHGGAIVQAAEHPAALKLFLGHGECRSGLWMMLLPLVLCAATDCLPTSLSPLLFGLRRILLIYSAIGVVFTLMLIHTTRTRMAFRTTSNVLERRQLGGLFRSRRSWERKKIGAIRVGYQIGDKGILRCVVELVLNDGNLVVLTSGGILVMWEWSAALRKVLNVPAELNDPAVTGPSVPAWHLVDDPNPPEGCPLITSSWEGELRVRKPASGFSVGRLIALGVFMLGLVGAAITPLIAWRFVVKPDDRHWMMACILMFGTMGILGILACIASARDEFEFVAGLEKLELKRRQWRRWFSRSWRRENIACIGTELEFPNNPHSAARLSIVLRDGKKYKISGKPLVMRYLATLLREAMRVGAQ
jgi:hypothetical protein